MITFALFALVHFGQFANHANTPVPESFLREDYQVDNQELGLCSGGAVGQCGTYPWPDHWGPLEDPVGANDRWMSECNEHSSLFAIPSWHEFLLKKPNFTRVTEGRSVLDEVGDALPIINVGQGVNYYAEGTCTPIIDSAGDVWKVALSLLQMVIRLASYAAIGMIIYAGFIYSISQGRAEKLEESKKTILYAVVGLALTLLATPIVAFGARLIK